MVKKITVTALSLMALMAISADPQDALFTITKQEGKDFLIGAAFGAAHGAANVMLTQKITDAKTRELVHFSTGSAALFATEQYIHAHARPYQQNPSQYPFGGKIVKPSIAISLGHGIAQGLVEGSYNPATHRFDRIGFSVNLSQFVAAYRWIDNKITNYCHHKGTQEWIKTEKAMRQDPQLSWGASRFFDTLKILKQETGK